MLVNLGKFFQLVLETNQNGLFVPSKNKTVPALFLLLPYLHVVNILNIEVMKNSLSSEGSFNLLEEHGHLSIISGGAKLTHSGWERDLAEPFKRFCPKQGLLWGPSPLSGAINSIRMVWGSASQSYGLTCRLSIVSSWKKRQTLALIM